MLLEQFDSFRKNDLSIYTLRCHESNLAVCGIELNKALEDSVLAVSNPVVGEVSEGYGVGRSCQSGYVS